MTRSPLTLAASVTAALPGAGVVGTASLTSGESGRYDAALVTLDDARQVVVRVPTDAAAAADLAAEAIALRALTTGVRALLPFRAPRLLGETSLEQARVIVVDMLPGYRVDAAHVPPGPGAAESIGISLAALHALPTSVVRSVGLPVRTPEQVRDAVRVLVDRAVATRRLPPVLASRWRDALDDDAQWLFESCVVLGEAGSSSFLFEEPHDVPTVTGVLDWHALAVGDPAVDLHWLAAAPQAADDVFASYSLAAHRSPDAHVRTRARLYAELEFAKWLVHGHEVHRADIVDDAVVLLDALVEGLGDDVSSLAPVGSAGVGDDWVELADASAPVGSHSDAGEDADGSTSMQTDAYDPDMLSLFAAKDREHAAARAEAARTRAASTDDAPAASTGASGSDSTSATDSGSYDDVSTAPIDISAWSRERQASAASDSDGRSPFDEADDGPDEEREAERASRAAFQRWASSASE